MHMIIIPILDNHSMGSVHYSGVDPPFNWPGLLLWLQKLETLYNSLLGMVHVSTRLYIVIRRNSKWYNQHPCLLDFFLLVFKFHKMKNLDV